jgi:hypothetical protein
MPGRKMGTIIGRSRKDGLEAFIAQIVIKKDGAIVTGGHSIREGNPIRNLHLRDNAPVLAVSVFI